MKQTYERLLLCTSIGNLVVLTFLGIYALRIHSQQRRISAVAPDDVHAAEFAYQAYQANPTNEMAVLRLQIAIRKNPSNLQYIKTLKAVVEDSGFDLELVQEYRSMLAYCLDNVSTEGMEELVELVKEFRIELSERQQRNENVQPENEVQNPIAELDFTIESAKEIIEINVFKSEKAIVSLETRTVCEENDLREVLSELGNPAVLQPVKEAQQMAQALYGLDMSSLSEEETELFRAKIRSIDDFVRLALVHIDKIKADKIADYVDSMSESITSSSNATFSARLDVCEKQGKAISRFIGCINDSEVANELLDKQISILEYSRDIQRSRMKAYQAFATSELKDIARSIQDYKEKWSRKGYKKEQAIPLLKRIVTIDTTLLLPEVFELFQYEYSLLMSDFNAWIEAKKEYEYKAELMTELETIQKKRLEDL